MSHLQNLPGAISEIVASSADDGILTLTDRYGLMAAILDEFLEQEEEEAINRLLRRVVRGRIKVTNQISSDYLSKQMTRSH
ncbi:MAG: hypothetical protein F6K62_07825 [Sphaerospermopsis sp. SIO1G2]|nr:hypothetical protein [Sphaerospermopsis sp. SIO1G1]NET70856.1 hypothetical protein [Sphaerospermopsis sp. SIO1G2]